MLLSMSPSITSCVYTGMRKSQAASPLTLPFLGFFAGAAFFALSDFAGFSTGFGFFATGLSSRTSSACVATGTASS